MTVGDHIIALGFMLMFIGLGTLAAWGHLFGSFALAKRQRVERYKNYAEICKETYTY